MDSFKSLFLALGLLLIGGSGFATAGNFTVTHEAWFEVEVRELDGPGEDFRGKFTIALFGETVPMTVLNFASLANGYKMKQQTFTYKNTYVHRIVKDFVVQLGDVVRGDGTGSISIYGEKFNDENFILSHRSPGWVAMANHGTDTNGSQFYILLTKARWMDGKHVVFGKVIRGMEVIKQLGELDSDHQAIPKKRVKIVDCGAKQLKTPWEMTPAQLDLEKDLPASV